MPIRWTSAAAPIALACAGLGLAGQEEPAPAAPPAQESAAAQEPPRLPDAWLAGWVGRATTTTADGKTLEYPMELHVKRQDASGDYMWRMFYGQGAGRVLRDYRLVPVAGRAADFLLDEQNGIRLDCHLHESVLFCQFEAGDSLVHLRFEIAGSELVVEMVTYSTEGARAQPVNDGKDAITSFSFRSVQRGRLARQG